MERNVEKRFDPQQLVAEARTAVVCAVSYKNRFSEGYPPDCHTKVASYACNRDYHTTIREMLRQLFGALQKDQPDLRGRTFVDTAPLAEKQLAVEAGLGWIGRQSLLVTPQYGSFVLLGELLLCDDADAYDTPFEGSHCGTCRACMEHCPTGAIVAPRIIDTNRCISCHTIEQEPPQQVDLHGWLFGCDTCQSCCPYNRQAPQHAHPAFDHVFDPLELTPETWLAMTDKEFAERMGETPLPAADWNASAGTARDLAVRPILTKFGASLQSGFIMNIAIVGTGYVGLVSGACFAEMGIDVTCIDINRAKIERLLAGEIPIYEPGLSELVKRNVDAGRLHFTTDLCDCLDRVEVVFSAVGTPPDEDGSADLRHVLEVARTFGRNIRKYTILVTKSTVPVGTAERIKTAIREELAKRGEDIPFEVASNPEFLKEGAAIKDFMSPDRVVVGIESERARKIMTRLYRPFLTNHFRVYFMDIPSAEMTKYAANAMLATRVSFMNDIANLCERVGADVNMVRRGIGSDSRIGKKFLYPGCGYGGSCFPKDVKALIKPPNRTAIRCGCCRRSTK